MAKNHQFESETDTEIISKLTLHMYRDHPNHTFQQIVELVIQQLVSALDGTTLSRVSTFFRQDQRTSGVTYGDLPLLVPSDRPV